MKFDFEVCFLRFLGFCEVMMKTSALIKIKKKIFKKSINQNHNKVSFSLNNWTSCLAKQ
jgi:hypothetical protein